MEILAEKLAGLLEIGVEGAKVAYPYLREQFVWWKVLDIIGFVGLFATLFLVVLTFFLAIDRNPCDEEDMDVFKVAVVSTLVVIGITVASFILQVVVAPDIVMIRDFL